MTPQDSAAEIVAAAEADLAARDGDLSAEEVVNRAIGKPPGRQVRTGEHTYVIEENN